MHAASCLCLQVKQQTVQLDAAHGRLARLERAAAAEQTKAAAAARQAGLLRERLQERRAAAAAADEAAGGLLARLMVRGAIQAALLGRGQGEEAEGEASAADFPHSAVTGTAAVSEQHRASQRQLEQQQASQKQSEQQQQPQRQHAGQRQAGQPQADQGGLEQQEVGHSGQGWLAQLERQAYQQQEEDQAGQAGTGWLVQLEQQRLAGEHAALVQQVEGLEAALAEAAAATKGHANQQQKIQVGPLLACWCVWPRPVSYYR